MIQRDRFAQYAADPLTFFQDLEISTGSGTVRWGDVIQDFQLERLKALAPALLAVARGEMAGVSKFMFEGTKGCNKTGDATTALIWRMIFDPHRFYAQVAAADRDQAAELKRTAQGVLDLNPLLAEFIEVQAWSLRNPHTGSQVDIVAADIAGSHGGKPDMLVIDELAHITKSDFILNLLDNATKMPRCLVIICTNAGFTGTEAWKIREIARTSPRWFFHRYDRPSPWTPQAEIEEAAKRNSVSRQLRLWWCVWSSGSGDALDAADLEAAVDKSLGPLIAPVPEYIFTAGLDLGIRHDHSALVLLATHSKTRRIRLAMAKAWAPINGKVSLEAVQEFVLAIHRSHSPVAIAYDPYQAELMASQCSRAGCKMVEVPFTGANLNLMASTLLETFRSRAIDLFPCPDLIRDLGRLSIVEKSYGYRLESTRDADGHADLATALALALPQAAVARPRTFGIWVSGDSDDTSRATSPEQTPGTLAYANRNLFRGF